MTSTAQGLSVNGSETATGHTERRSAPSWKPLIAQPLLVGVGVIAFTIWRATITLSPTQARQLGGAALGDSVIQHLQLTAASAGAVVAIAVPLGIALTRRRIRRLTPAVMAVANTGQAAPSIGLFVLLASSIGFGFRTAVLTLVLYATLPVLRNTVVGIQGVEPALIEAARGMGMSPLAVLLRVELPLAVPVILAGVRTALVLLVGTATLATFVDGGGLGALINTGITLSLNSLIVSGALLVALLALAVDWLGRLIEQLARPKGL